MPTRHRGRRAASEFEVPPLQLVAAARMKAPAGLPRAAQAIWRTTLASYPADFFRPSDAALLKAWCTAAAMADEATAVLAREGMFADNGHGRQMPHPAVGILSTCTAMLNNVGMKLRLTPSARMRIDAAATRANAAPASKRPWT
ncbi:phage terminase small subunit P27 family [Paraburkholderia sp. RL18-103-BIB-C]|uniref:phage terminase small subunit P27 family n=1 Tax=Paraburkholderia sp. RL18-103-BIB-C TaxID=3031637 RepID=UPI0038BE15CB